MDFTSKCPHCGAAGQMSLATQSLFARIKPGRGFAVCEACKALSPIPKTKGQSLSRRCMNTMAAGALGGIFSGIFKSVTDVLIGPRSRVTTLNPGTATLKITPGLPSIKITLGTPMPKDALRATTLRFTLGTPVPKDAA